MPHFLVRPILGAAAVAALGLLSACASVPAVAPDLPAPAATRWQAPLPHGGRISELSDWWSQFNDPTLPALIAAAQAASPTGAAARARIERARAARTAAGAGLLPQFDAVGQLSSGRALPGQAVATSASLGVQAAWELDLAGAAAAGRDAAQARLEGAQAGWYDARVSVAAEVATAYIALRGCEAQILQSRLDAESRAETTRLTELTARAGFTAPADAALARAGAAQSRGLVLSQQALCTTMLKSLVEITAIDEPELRQRLVERSALQPQPAAIVVSTLPASLLSQRADLAASARDIVAAASDQAQAQARERPQVSLSGSLAGSLAGVSLRSGGVSSSGATWSLGPLVVSFPIFDGGARAAARAAAKASYDEALARYRAQLRQAVREVETSLVVLDSTAARQLDAGAAARDFEASLRATQARHKGGLASLFELEAARRNAVQAHSALIELQRERAAGWVALYRALGGGWTPADLAATAPP